MNQTELSDADRAILSRLVLPALRNESRLDDGADYRAMADRELEARHFQSVARQVATRETIMRQIEREQAR